MEAGKEKARAQKTRVAEKLEARGEVCQAASRYAIEQGHLLCQVPRVSELLRPQV